MKNKKYVKLFSIIGKEIASLAPKMKNEKEVQWL